MIESPDDIRRMTREELIAVVEETRDFEKLKRSEWLLKQAQRIGNLGVYDYDVLNDCWSSSPEMNRIFGIDDAYPRTLNSWSLIIHPDHRDRMVNYFRQIVSAKSWFDMEYPIIRPNDGVVRWLYGTGEFMLDNEGNAIRMIGTIVDITERKTIENELLDREERYRIFSSLTTDYVYACIRRGDEPYRVRWMAGAFEMITGYSQEELFAIGCWLKIVHPDDCRRVHDGMMSLIPGNTHASDFRLVRKDGTVRWIHEVCRCEKGDADDELKLYGTSCDITVRKQYEHEIQVLNENLEHLVAIRTAELNKTNEELASFSYAVSHELRAPIARLQGFSRAIIEDYQHDRELGFLAQRIEVASLQLQQVVDAILMLSRLSRTELDRTSFDISDLAGTVSAALGEEQPGRQTVFSIEPGLMVTADRKMITVCLVNLIGNALKYSANEPVSRIAFGSMKEHGETVYFVRDNGAGFDMAYSDKLYLPFQRLHQQDEFPGMGIGLATVQRIIERHGGRLWAEGSVGGGATFYFTLP